MPDQTADFGNGQSMVFKKYEPAKVPGRPLSAFKAGDIVHYCSGTYTSGYPYTVVDYPDGSRGYVNYRFEAYREMAADGNRWYAKADVNPDGTVKFVDGGDRRTYGSLVAGDVFEFQEVACHKRIENGSVGYTPLLNISRAGSFPPMEGDEPVKYLGRFEST